MLSSKSTVSPAPSRTAVELDVVIPASIFSNDGIHSIQIFANDTCGNMNSAESISFTIDTTAPVVNVISPVDDSTDIESNIIIKITATDVSGIGSVIAEIDEELNITLVYDSENGYLYVTNSTTNFVSVVDTATNEKIESIPVGSNPRGIAIDVTLALNEVYVCGFGSNALNIINPVSSVPDEGKIRLGNNEKIFSNW